MPGILSNQRYILSPAYDILPVNLILPEDKDEFALTLHGKNRNLRRNDFLKFAIGIGISEKATNSLLLRTISLKETLIVLCHDSYLPDEMKHRFILLISERINTLQG